MERNDIGYNLAAIVERANNHLAKAALLPFNALSDYVKDQTGFVENLFSVEKTGELIQENILANTMFPFRYGALDFFNPAFSLNLLTDMTKGFGRQIDLINHVNNTLELIPEKVATKVAEEINRPAEYAKVILRKVPKASWSTPNKIIEVPGLEGVILRDFTPYDAKKVDASPLIIGGPNAGHRQERLVDKEGRSIVKTALESGLNNVFVLDWQSATPNRRHDNIDSYIKMTKTSIDAIRQKYYGGKNVPVNLVGLCQNGWQMTMYTARFPKDVQSLIIAGAPIDPQAGNSDVKLLCNNLPLSFYKSLKDKDGLLDGKYTLMGFVNCDPVGRVKDFVDLSNKVYDKKHVERYKQHSDWYYHDMVKLPGDFFEQIVKEHFMESRLVNGKMEVLGKTINLKDIGPSKGHYIITIGGTNDNITDPIELHCLADYVSGNGGTGYKRDKNGKHIPTNLNDVEKILYRMRKNDEVAQLDIEAGHIGVFVGEDAILRVYPAIFRTIGEINYQRN